MEAEMRWPWAASGDKAIERIPVMTILAKFAKCESGATAIEYSLIAAMIGLGLITAATNVGSELQEPFNDVQATLQDR